jgi:hypothetical protein
VSRVLAEGRRRTDNQPVPGARVVLTLARGVFFTFAGSAALLGGGLALIASTVGVCAVVGVLLYALAHLFGYAFGIGFRWGLVIACWLFLVVPPVGALVHDVRMHRKLALPAKSPHARA